MDEGCILLDIFLNEKSGLEIQDEIKTKFPNLPIIYITGNGNIPMSVQALKKGAINFLQKPVDEQHLIDSVEEALMKSRDIVAHNYCRSYKIFVTHPVTKRTGNFQIDSYGKLNKQIASDLNIAEHTVKIHRGNITKKLGVKSVAELVRIAEKAGLL